MSACVTYTNSFLSVMNSSAADSVLKHWLVVMKKRAPILMKTQSVLLLTHTHTVTFHLSLSPLSPSLPLSPLSLLPPLSSFFRSFSW